MNKKEIQIGDLVTWKKDQNLDLIKHMATGIVIGLKKIVLDLDNPIDTEVVVVLWNGNTTTKVSPLVLRKL